MTYRAQHITTVHVNCHNTVCLRGRACTVATALDVSESLLCSDLSIVTQYPYSDCSSGPCAH